MYHMPTVDEWWALTEKYPQFRKPSNLTLKEYGYMRLFELIEERRPARILEYGHGFSGLLFAFCAARGIEVWGVDDHMDLPYFPPRDVWLGRHRTELAEPYPATRFVLGQLGTDLHTAAALPKGHFDLVCSVSVLEEIGSRDIIVSIARHARELLRPGGVFANTHDINYGDQIRTRFYMECLEAAGYDATPRGEEAGILNDVFGYRPFNKVLLENPTQAMLCYNAGGPERTYSGHWSTIFSVSEPLPSA